MVDGNKAPLLHFVSADWFNEGGHHENLLHQEHMSTKFLYPSEVVNTSETKVHFGNAFGTGCQIADWSGKNSIHRKMVLQNTDNKKIG